jgi:hypothetical protein
LDSVAGGVLGDEVDQLGFDHLQVEGGRLEARRSVERVVVSQSKLGKMLKPTKLPRHLHVDAEAWSTIDLNMPRRTVPPVPGHDVDLPIQRWDRFALIGNMEWAPAGTEQIEPTSSVTSSRGCQRFPGRRELDIEEQRS